jgi:hypothetical protein
MRQETHDVDLCVVGGGLAGMCTALAAARHGAKVILMQDRPVLGGNASSECRVQISGAARGGAIPHVRETGILEELRLENLYRNPHEIFTIQDTVFYEKLQFEPNLDLLLNCSCQDVEMDGNRIVSVTGWQLTTETKHTVKADLFADCSGDGILAPLTGAEFRVGREARSEYGESIAPEEADDKTMGMTMLFFSREYDTPQPFEPPDWAYTFEDCDDMPYGEQGHRRWTCGYWWVELGGEYDSIHDTEKLRDELLKISYGVWDHLKNHCEHKEQLTNYAIDWVQFLPAKRESRRYVGEHVLTQNDVEAEGRFEDIVAYGGWTMDDHHPAGFWSVKTGEPATIFHPAPSPYGIPYRSLYSVNVENLMFAGRNASASHAAMSSTRLMGTCAVMGQAAGTAAAMAVERDVNPEDVKDHMDELQQTLLRDDCYLPWVQQEFGPLTMESQLTANQGDPEPVRDGWGRQIEEDPHAWVAHPGDHVAYVFPEKAHVEDISLVLDSELAKRISHSWNGDRLNAIWSIPPVMPRRFHIDGLIEGKWQTLQEVDKHHQRFVRIDLDRELEGVRFVLDETWGSDASRVYAFYVD